ncbi:replication initiator protein A [Cytobacillus oceanisediminis]|uniref:Replication initiator protein A n=1 Tax=Cytobacillus oceanisediminis TaxID=665099 RepID=A0A2V2ZTV0_9BACI|nr:replication initiator protein A [Cytobacillus oceanisediminis]PWW27799.1 replication initiator protein A [Cytobacillus oceanisediminis]
MDNKLSISQQQFVKLPKIFKGHSVYKGLSDSSIILYSYGLDTLQISKQNDWFDHEKQEYYILYSIEKIMEDMNCSKPKAIRLRKELEKYGLWEMIHQGANKPTIIFIRELIHSQEPKKKLRYNVKPRNEPKPVNKTDMVTVNGKEIDYTEIF